MAASVAACVAGYVAVLGAPLRVGLSAETEKPLQDEPYRARRPAHIEAVKGQVAK